MTDPAKELAARLLDAAETSKALDRNKYAVLMRQAADQLAAATLRIEELEAALRVAEYCGDVPEEKPTPMTEEQLRRDGW